jgi:hypothetical protein
VVGVEFLVEEECVNIFLGVEVEKYRGPGKSY